MNKSEYNQEPVEYCTVCYSLAIRDMNGQPYCDKCGNTTTEKTDVYTWLNLHKNNT